MEKQTAEGESKVVAPVSNLRDLLRPTRCPPLNLGSITSSNMTRLPTIRTSFSRSSYSKPNPTFKRFAEPLYDITEAIPKKNITSELQEELNVNSSCRSSYDASSPIDKSGTVKGGASNTPEIAWEDEVEDVDDPLLAWEDKVEDEDKIIYKLELSKGKHKRLTTKVLIEWFLFLCIVGILLASLTIDKLKEKRIWGLGLWKWCVLVMVTFYGIIGTKWFMFIIVFLIEKNFYFVHGLNKCVHVFIWLGSLLLTWVLVINHGVPRSKLATKILDSVTWTLICLLIGAFLLLLKTLLLDILALNFHVKYFFNRIHKSIFHQYVFQTLSGPPRIGEAAKVGGSLSTGQLSFRSTKEKGGTKEEVIDMAKFLKMKREKVSACTMKTLINAVKNSGLSTISNSQDESLGYGEEITNATEATATAYHIFRNVAAPGCT